MNGNPFDKFGISYILQIQSDLMSRENKSIWHKISMKITIDLSTSYVYFL